MPEWSCPRRAVDGRSSATVGACGSMAAMTTIADTGRDQQGAWATLPSRAGALAGVRDRAAGDPAARPGGDRRPGPRAGRGAADRGQGPARATAARTPAGSSSRSCSPWVATLLTAVAAYLLNVRLFRTTEAGLAHPAGARVPARPRPVGAHPERRAARVAGVPGDQRRGHDLDVHAVGRAADGGQPRPAGGGDRADGGLLLAAHRCWSGSASCRCSCCCGPSSAGCPARTARSASGSATCSARSPSRSSGPRPCGPTAIEERTGHRIDGAIERHRSAATRAQALVALTFSTGEVVAGLANAAVVDRRRPARHRGRAHGG